MPAVTELIVAELLYLQYKDRQKPIYLYINSTGTTRADGETVSTNNVALTQLSLQTRHLTEQLADIMSYSAACVSVSYGPVCLLVRSCHVCESCHSHAGGI